MNSVILVTFCFYAGAYGQITVRGICDECVYSMKDFDIERVNENWYALETLGDGSLIGECPMRYVVRYGEKKLIGNTTFTENGIPYQIVECFDQTGSGHMNMFEMQYSTRTSPPVAYKVLDTDYETYGLIYYCNQVTPDFKTITAYKYSRNTPYPTKQVREKLDFVASLYPELVNGPWHKYDFSNCVNY